MNIVRVSRTFPPVVDGTSMHMYELSKYQNKLANLTLLIPGRGVRYMEFKNTIYVSVNNDRIFSSTIEKIRFHFNAVFKNYQIIKDSDVVHVVGDIHDSIILVLMKPFFSCKVILSIHAGISSNWLYQQLIRLIFPFLDRIYVVSANISDQLSFLPKDMVFIQSSGINYNDIKKKDINNISANKQNVKLVSLGRLNIMKAYQYLIESMMYLPECYNLTIIGDGEERKSLNELVKNLSLEDRVQLVGELERSEIHDKLCEYDIFVMSSIKLKNQEEGTPTAMMEAMGAGLPIVSTDTGGVRDLLDGYPDNCIVPQRDSSRLAQSIDYVASNVKLQIKLSQLSLKIAQGKDWSIVSKRITEMFEKVVSQ